MKSRRVILILCIALILISCGDRQSKPGSPPVSSENIPGGELAPLPPNVPPPSSPVSLTPPTPPTNLPEAFEQFSTAIEKPIPFGCAPVAVAGINVYNSAISGAGKSVDQFSKELSQKYGMVVKGDGRTMMRLQLLANVLARLPPNVRARSINFFDSHRRFLQAGQGRKGADAVTDYLGGGQPTVSISPNALARNPALAEWIIAHEFGHVDHGNIGPGRNAEDIANRFATQIMGYSEEQAMGGIPA